MAREHSKAEALALLEELTQCKFRRVLYTPLYVKHNDLLSTSYRGTDARDHTLLRIRASVASLVPLVYVDENNTNGARHSVNASGTATIFPVCVSTVSCLLGHRLALGHTRLCHSPRSLEQT